MPGTYSHTTRADGSILTGSIYNQDHNNHITFNTPGGCDDYSTNVTQMQSMADPGEFGTESLPTDLAGELQRIRKILTEITGKTYWYESPGTSLAADVDNVFRIVGSGDATKKLAFEVDGITAGQTRTITPPDADITLANVTTAGDLVIASGAGVQTRLPVGAGGTIPMSRAAASLKLAYVAALNKAIYGLTYDVGTDTTNDININTGGCMDETGAYWMTLDTALGKQSDNAWAVGGTTGAPAGWLDTGAVGNSDYYIWLIARSDTGVVDSLCSLSSTAPTMPANYDFKRLIGWFKRVGGTIVGFKTYETEGGGLDFAWTTPTLDINSAALTTSRLTAAVKVPQNFSTIAHIRVALDDASVAARVLVMCPDETDTAASETVAPLFNVFSPATSFTGGTELRIRTSSTGTISARAVAQVDAYRVVTQGFHWARRN